VSVSALRRCVLLLVVTSFVVSAAIVLVTPRASAGAAIVFSEDFEQAPLGSRWTVVDADNGSGLDYWGISDFRAHGGNYSLWGAQVGNQSSGTFAGQNNSDPGVQEYDDNMQADLSVDLRVNGYTSLTLSFFYFIKTENGGGDWIQAWYEANGTQTVIFNPRGSSAGSWTNETLSVPNDIERLIIRFHTDTSNHGFEGAYVDDVVLVGTEDTPPASSVSSLPNYSNDQPYLVPYTAQDNANASGVDHVELWYRMGTSGAFSLFTTASNPLGRWIGPTIPFDASLAGGDGYYEFYTIAVDRAGNRESPPSAADASVTIDTTAPSLSITAPSAGAALAENQVTVEWQAADALSGIDHYEATLDGGSPQSTGTTASIALTGLVTGDHTVTVRAYDRAGNVRELSVSFSVSASAFPWWIVLLIIAVLMGGIILFLWWRRRQEEKEDEELLEKYGQGSPEHPTEESAETQPEEQEPERPS